jgi:hypothetical protein
LKFCRNSPVTGTKSSFLWCNPRETKKPKKYNFFNRSTIQTYSEVEIHDTFSFQLGFSMTVHKAQGRTIDKVVLDLHYKSNHRKWLGFDGIFVSLENITKSKTNSGAITMLLTD